jgi:carbon monoxide dehydrogenase subunit G
MRFEGQFRVARPPDEVMALFADVERMARCIPGAELDGRDADGTYLGAVTVAFGPKRIRFAGKAAVEFDVPARRGKVRGWATADLRAARIQVQTAFQVCPGEDDGAASTGSVVSIVSDAELGGVLAAFAQTGGQAVGQLMLTEFAERLAAEFAATPPATTPKSLNAPVLFWTFVRATWTGFIDRLRAIAGGRHDRA